MSIGRSHDYFSKIIIKLNDRITFIVAQIKYECVSCQVTPRQTERVDDLTFNRRQTQVLYGEPANSPTRPQ